ncbi:hypothetical protein [Pseudonocardia charpentierae]|nr:hypothetical protein [Pseudonocardia sp. DSM 45834]
MLQRQAGNAAVVSLVQGSGSILALQRSPDASPLTLPAKPKFTDTEYAKWRKAHPKHESRSGGGWEPDYLYKRYTPKWFASLGYEYGLRIGPFGNVQIDVWIDEKGKGREFRVIHWIDSSPAGPSGPNAPPGTKPDAKNRPLTPLEKGADLPDRIPPNADYEKLFGKAIGRKENIEAGFGSGTTVLYEDGSVVLFLDEGGTYVFRPVPGGRYVVYDPSGKRLSNVWELPDADIPDLDEEEE